MKSYIFEVTRGIAFIDVDGNHAGHLEFNIIHVNDDKIVFVHPEAHVKRPDGGKAKSIIMLQYINKSIQCSTGERSVSSIAGNELAFVQIGKYVGTPEATITTKEFNTISETLEAAKLGASCLFTKRITSGKAFSVKQFIIDLEDGTAFDFDDTKRKLDFYINSFCKDAKIVDYGYNSGIPLANTIVACHGGRYDHAELVLKALLSDKKEGELAIDNLRYGGGGGLSHQSKKTNTLINKNSDYSDSIAAMTENPLGKSEAALAKVEEAKKDVPDPITTRDPLGLDL